MAILDRRIYLHPRLIPSPCWFTPPSQPRLSEEPYFQKAI